MGRVKRATSAGGVIFKEEDGKVWVALISPREGIWALPKGLVEGEKKEEAALREVFEETGLRGEIIEELGQIDYWFFDRKEMAKIHKFVYFYLMRYLEGDTKDHDWEVQEAKWFSIEEAKEKLSYPTERKILEKAEEWLLNHGYLQRMEGSSKPPSQ